MFIDIGKGLLSRQRLPRVFINRPLDYLYPITGVNLILQDRSSYPVLDMNLSGLVIALPSFLNQFRPGQFIECKLKIDGVTEQIQLKLQSHSRNALMACLILGSIAADDRLKMDQALKNHMIFSHLRKMPIQILRSEFHDYQWWTGLFDTNFLCNKNKAIIEYDGVILFIETNDEKSTFWVQKSVPTVDPSLGYEGVWTEKRNQKIIMGEGWLERAIYNIQGADSRLGLDGLVQLLRNI